MTQRILHVVGRLDVGGIETYLLDFIREAQVRGTNSHVLTMFERVPGVLEPRFQELGCKVFSAHAVRARKCFKATVARALAEVEPDVIHAHAGEMSGDAAKLCKQLGHRNVVVQAHDLGGLVKLRQAPYRIAARRWTLSFADRLLAVSNLAGSNLVGQSGRNFAVVPPGIPLADWRAEPGVRQRIRNALEISAPKQVILHVGRFNPVKNHSFVIEIAEQLAKAGVDFVLLLVGEGETKENIERRAKQLAQCGLVQFLGARADVADLMRAADILLLPSLSEGMPRVLLEATAIGLPWVASTSIDLQSIFNAPATLDVSSSDRWAQAILSGISPQTPKIDLSIARAVDQTLAAYQAG